MGKYCTQAGRITREEKLNEMTALEVKSRYISINLTWFMYVEKHTSHTR